MRRDVAGLAPNMHMRAAAPHSPAQVSRPAYSHGHSIKRNLSALLVLFQQCPHALPASHEALPLIIARQCMQARQESRQCPCDGSCEGWCRGRKPQRDAALVRLREERGERGAQTRPVGRRHGGPRDVRDWVR
ncbi:hypothetical protein FA09DRAFT_62184 [Tilletiopsis washingtonensis]|uniref:Uncharacterized protein n=1 Tax=Tilletiopsis washingtonensis TaxID=58919 RepID=A0A316Z876_9BASI|nr:hypothetical protein FA09DRAFT_62184 [Tilletiopsis washingtonensis]PWN97142.1 hypothetical protein FA09DRAFT_62184 [Tilletiopsis washingtonensis]